MILWEFKFRITERFNQLVNEAKVEKKHRRPQAPETMNKKLGGNKSYIEQTVKSVAGWGGGGVGGKEPRKSLETDRARR